MTREDFLDLCRELSEEYLSVKAKDFKAFSEALFNELVSQDVFQEEYQESEDDVSPLDTDEWQ